MLKKLLFGIYFATTLLEAGAMATNITETGSHRYLQRTGKMKVDFCTIFYIFHYYFHYFQFCVFFSRQQAGVGGSKKKRSRLNAYVSTVLQEPLPAGLKPESWSEPHRSSEKFVIFAAAMILGLSSKEVNQFCGSARKVGFTGDIVVAIMPEPDTAASAIVSFKKTKSTVYSIATECKGISHDMVCSLKSLGDTNKYSINMIRYYLYKWWATNYDKSTIIMLSDFRDVLFQSNPFTYRTFEWTPPAAQLVVFQEPHPIKVISRCVFNSGWIENCYGKESHDRVASNTVSCSGVSIGTRDAILLYGSMMIKQLQPEVRYEFHIAAHPDFKPPPDNKKCTSLGMDQGFHNWLLYSGQLDKYLDVKIYQQGEGPVNTVGAFGGGRAIIKWSLEKWGVLKGVSPNKYFANWNGDKSPVVHQLDRYLETSLRPGYDKHLAAIQGIE